MAGISGLGFNNFYGLGSSGVNTLFSSMNKNVSGTSSIAGLQSEFSSIKNGSYSKLLKSYYNQNQSAESTAKSDKSASKAKNSGMNETLSNIKSKADSLKTAADKLTATGDKSVFEKKNGEYDKDAIYKSVSSFVDSYNSAIGSTKDSTSSSVASAVNSMNRTTSVMSNSLSKLGISTGKDGKLSIDEETFKKADMDKVKTMFNGSSSYAANIASTASRLSGSASNALNSSSSGTYSSGGMYANAVSGSNFSSYF